MIIEIFSTGLETIFEQFDVSAAAIATLLILDFILNNERLLFEADWSRERSRDSMMSSLVLRHKAQVALDNRSCWLFNLPFTDITESVSPNRRLLGSF